MSHRIDQRETPVLKDLLEASKAAERLISALFELGGLEGEPFMSIWYHLVRAMDRTERALGTRPTALTKLDPPNPAA